ncbi:hypothetical protein, partial [Klebsiella pneumoniae]|uniref:hypothetical protein n=1 Tax=Klebsiella pneumoniae TaxID=573 RepID=UPI001C70EAFC
QHHYNLKPEKVLQRCQNFLFSFQSLISGFFTSRFILNNTKVKIFNQQTAMLHHGSFAHVLLSHAFPIGPVGSLR